MDDQLDKRGSDSWRFFIVAVEFETLKREFANCVDSSLRHCLPQEM
jgi:hypothetical protein